jgi:hypothetical protein
MSEYTDKSVISAIRAGIWTALYYPELIKEDSE